MIVKAEDGAVGEDVGVLIVPIIQKVETDSSILKMPFVFLRLLGYYS